MKTIKRLTAAAAAALLLLASGCSGTPSNTVNTPEDLPGKNAGIYQSSMAASYADELSENGIHTALYEDMGTMADQLASGTLDCIIADSASSDTILKHSRKIKVLKPAMYNMEFTVAVAVENPNLVSDINSALAGLRDAETLDTIINAFLDGDGYTYTPGEHDHVLRLAVDTESAPLAYYNEEGVLTGINVEIAKAVCDKLGLGVEMVEVDSEDIIKYVKNGKAEFGMDIIPSQSAEAENILCSDAYFMAELQIIVRK